MDANLALQNLRFLAEKVKFLKLSDETTSALILAESFLVLDRWISQGGTLPDDWALYSPPTLTKEEEGLLDNLIQRLSRGSGSEKN